MRYIYEPRGAAREYAPLALNLYRGCTHGCTYCYCPAILRMSPADFHAGSVPRVDLEALSHELDAWQGPKDKTILLSFTSDPYQPAEEVCRLTRKVLIRLGAWRFRATVLTKAGDLPRRDFDVLKQYNYPLGLTICTLQDWKREQMEPGASTIPARLKLLADAKAQGIRTWVSVEPVYDPSGALVLLPHLEGLADTIRVGRWNHSAEANRIDWSTFLRQVLEEAEAYGLNLYIKDELAKAGPVPDKYRRRPLG